MFVVSAMYLVKLYFHFEVLFIIEYMTSTYSYLLHAKHQWQYNFEESITAMAQQYIMFCLKCINILYKVYSVKHYLFINHL